MTPEEELRLSQELADKINGTIQRWHDDKGNPEMDADVLLRAALIVLSDTIVECSDSDLAKANAAARCIHFLETNCEVSVEQIAQQRAELDLMAASAHEPGNA